MPSATEGAPLILFIHFRVLFWFNRALPVVSYRKLTIAMIAMLRPSQIAGIIQILF